MASFYLVDALDILRMRVMTPLDFNVIPRRKIIDLCPLP